MIMSYNSEEETAIPKDMASMRVHELPHRQLSVSNSVPENAFNRVEPKTRSCDKINEFSKE